MTLTVTIGTVLAGFRVESLIAEGATGSVYLARDTTRSACVALKVLDPGLSADERFRRRFLRESELAESLHHPHVVPTITSGEQDGVLYLAMPYIEGSDLREVLRDEELLEPGRAIDLVGQVSEALDAANATGLVHRDVKPGNILLEARPEGEHAYLCDFGLARHLSTPSSLTGDRGLIGTLDYIPPEQIEGRAIDGRADVYSLGCVLYECLTGERPFERESELALIYAHLNDTPPPVSDLRPELPEALDGVLAAALAKAPDERYATCGELVEAARAALAGKPYGRRSRRRRRSVIAMVALFVAAAVASAAYLTTRGEPAASGPPAITQTAIAGAKLGLMADAYKKRFGTWRQFELTEPGFPAFAFGEHKVAVYFPANAQPAHIITTWNKDHKTAAGIGPCSTIEEAKAAYGDELKPSSHGTQAGKVYAYTLGKNLIFAASGPPPNPAKFVTAVALYDGSAPGATEDGGSEAFAGFVAIQENACT